MKKDELIPGEMYRIVQDEGFSPWLYKKPEVDNISSRIGRVNPDQVVMYLDIVKVDNDKTIASWYYKLWADDQVGYVYGPNISLDRVTEKDAHYDKQLVVRESY